MANTVTCSECGTTPEQGAAFVVRCFKCEDAQDAEAVEVVSTLLNIIKIASANSKLNDADPRIRRAKEFLADRR